MTTTGMVIASIDEFDTVTVKVNGHLFAQIGHDDELESALSLLSAIEVAKSPQWAPSDKHGPPMNAKEQARMTLKRQVDEYVDSGRFPSVVPGDVIEYTMRLVIS